MAFKSKYTGAQVETLLDSVQVTAKEVAELKENLTPAEVTPGALDIDAFLRDRFILDAQWDIPQLQSLEEALRLFGTEILIDPKMGIAPAEGDDHSIITKTPAVAVCFTDYDGWDVLERRAMTLEPGDKDVRVFHFLSTPYLNPSNGFYMVKYLAISFRNSTRQVTGFRYTDFWNNEAREALDKFTDWVFLDSQNQKYYR